jgi:hypothetical protein
MQPAGCRGFTARWVGSVEVTAFACSRAAAVARLLELSVKPPAVDGS